MNLTQEARQKGGSAVKKKALNNEKNREATKAIVGLHMQGLNLTEIAAQLNSLGFTTATNKTFQPVQVKRLIVRLIADLNRHNKG